LTDRYFDNAATTPVDPRVLKEMLPYLEGDFGNADSIHAFGRKAMAAVDLARSRIATLIGAEDPSQVVFTSGATESNNWVLSAFPNAAISPFEHASLFEPARSLGSRILPPDLSTQGRFELLSIMSVNNETGRIFDVRAHRAGADKLHTDATQAIGKVPFDVNGIDFASFSAHKLYGPKGVGGLYFALDPPAPFLTGGSQQAGLRAGTLNVPGIVGFGAAAAIAQDEWIEDSCRACELRASVLDGLAEVSHWKVNGGPAVSPFILSISFYGVEGETLVIECDKAGYGISAGAACSSRSTEPSHVLLASGLDELWRRGTVRVSFGRFNSLESARGLARTLAHGVEKLRTMSMGVNNSRNVERVDARL
jgi:cysteine desulfurase